MDSSFMKIKQEFGMIFFLLAYERLFKGILVQEFKMERTYIALPPGTSNDKM